MTEITMDLIKKLRERTGIGINKCKEALAEANGDIELAIDNLRKAGMASAVKKEGRETSEGMIATAENEEAAVVVEVNAETDFVVRNEHFQAFAAEVAQQIVAEGPSSLESFLNSPSDADGSLTVDQRRASVVQTLGENVRIKRFERWAKGKDTSIGLYSHMGGKIVVMVEIVGSDQVSDLAREVAMHAAAESPDYLTPDDVPADVTEHEKEIARSQVQGKPANIIDKIVEGKVQAYYKQVCLTLQPFVKDSSTTVEQLVKNRGENLRIARFLRWQMGA